MAVSVAVLGVGAVGARAVRQLASSPEVSGVTITDHDAGHAESVCEAIADPARVRIAAPDGPWWEGADVAVLASPPGSHRAAAEHLLEAGVDVVSVSDAFDDVEALLALDSEARERGLRVVVGAGFAPGLTCLLAAHAAAGFDVVEEIHVARLGRGGPSCARQQRRALAGRALDWRGGWMRHPAGSGRELCWFPDPIGGADCYRAALADPLLLVPVFPGVERVTARVAAGRLDRIRARLPDLRSPPVEGGPGAVRVEVRGRRGPGTDVVVLGAIDRPAVAAGAVAAMAALRLRSSTGSAGSSGVASVFEPAPFLAELAQRGVKAAIFEGRAD